MQFMSQLGICSDFLAGLIKEVSGKRSQPGMKSRGSGSSSRRGLKVHVGRN